jgi:hypothetical protein
MKTNCAICQPHNYEMQNKPFVYSTSNMSCVNVKEAKPLRILRPIFRIFGHRQAYLWIQNNKISE